MPKYLPFSDKKRIKVVLKKENSLPVLKGMWQEKKVSENGLQLEVIIFFKKRIWATLTGSC